MTPRNLRREKMPYPMKPKAAMVAIVSKSVLKALEKHIPDEDKRVDVALDVCDDILRTLQRRREK